MKFLIVILAIFNCAQSMAAMSSEMKPEQISEIVFKDESKTHKYTLTKSGTEKPIFKLAFKADKAAAKIIELSESGADAIRNESTRIIWTARYAKPSSGPNCHRYVTVASGNENSHVCLANKKATGMAYGLLNSMNRYFIRN